MIKPTPKVTRGERVGCQHRRFDHQDLCPVCTDEFKRMERQGDIGACIFFATYFFLIALFVFIARNT